MRSIRILSYFLLIFILAGCGNKTQVLIERANSNLYAKGFNVEDFETYKKITVYNPWEQAKNISFSYYLFKKGKIVPDSLKGERIIFTPVGNVICLSTSHIAFLEALGESENIAGISGSQYVNSEKIRKKLQNEEVVDVGYDSGLNYELILQQKPELIFVYGIGSEVTTYVRKMEDLGLNVFFVAEYLEESPLGKTEWINCLAPLFEKETEAKSFFNKTEENYLKLQGKAAGLKPKPKVLVGLPYRDSWWIPGGKSYMANLISDAGGDYIGSNNESHESYVISFENALSIAGETDVWLNVGSVFSKNEIVAGDERFLNFPSFANARIYNNNKRLSPSGGNDFWESGTTSPDKILGDLFNIFYPDLSGERLLYYYNEIK